MYKRPSGLAKILRHVKSAMPNATSGELLAMCGALMKIYVSGLYCGGNPQLVLE
jgi:hypothetical protein